MTTRLAFVVALLTSAAASFGQAALGKMDPFFFHAADMGLLQAKPIQKELGITEAQRKRMNDFAGNHDKRIKTLAEQYEKQKKSPEEFQKDPRLVGYFLELKANVMAQLTATQLKRLAELSLQRVGYAALTDDKVATKIGMSKAQLEKMRTAFQEGAQKYAAEERKVAEPIMAKYKNKNVKDQKAAQALNAQFQKEMAAAIQKAAPRLNKVRSEAEAKMRGILTSAQHAKYKALLGKPFRPA